MIIRAVFFDLDGTLVDSLEDLTDAVNHIRDAFSHPPLTGDAVRLKVGKGARQSGPTGPARPCGIRHRPRSHSVS